MIKHETNSFISTELTKLANEMKKCGWRILIMTVMAIMVSYSSELRELIFASIADAYLQVTVFVAGTLFMVYLLEHTFGFDLGNILAQARWLQTPIASGLGAMPGCGGAIIVITHYTKGHVSFGGVVAVLIATMGDAAFLLLSQKPLTGLSIMALGFIVGTLSGWLVDMVHGPRFMRPESKMPKRNATPPPKLSKAATTTGFHFGRVWVLWAIPSAILGLMLAMQFDTDSLLFSSISSLQPTHWIGVTGGILSLLMWAFSSSPQLFVNPVETNKSESFVTKRVIKDTNFVTSWVVLGFLSYELAVYFSGSSIENWLKVWAPVVPLVAVLIGFIPGCGPQIVTTSLYLTGSIPLSAQLGNAISNDGDALFPALALAPRAAIYATLYSAVPAIFIAFGYYFFAESPIP